MKICPNLSDPTVKEQWDALVNDPTLGKTEAMREFIESEIDQRAIGSVAQVKAKLELRTAPISPLVKQATLENERKVILEKSNDPVFDDPESLMGNAIFNSNMTKNLTIENNANTRGIEVATKLAQQLGVTFQMVSPEDAVTITASSKNPYDRTKGAAFFYQGVIYFVGHSINTETAFHEFSHPLVRTLQQSNPELFQKLVNQAIAADQSLLEEVLAEYGDLREALEAETDPVRAAELTEKYQNILGEEILVKALTKASVAIDQKLALQGPFGKFIDALMFAIKQILRGNFGKQADVSKLNPSTTLDDLAEMLVKGGEFVIDTRSVSDKDVVAYTSEMNDYIEDLSKVTTTLGGQHITELARKMYEGTSQQIDMLMKNRNYADILELFVDDYNRGDLQEMRANVAKYAKVLDKKLKDLAEDVELTRTETQAVVTSILRLQMMMQKMEKHLSELSKDPNDRDNMHKAYYYKHVLTYWQKYIASAQATMLKARDINTQNISKNSMDQLLQAIETSMKKSESYINKMNTNGAAEVLWEQWQDMAENAEIVFNEQIAYLRKNKVNQSVIDNAFIEFHGMPEEGLIKLKALQDLKASGAILTAEELDDLEALTRLSMNGISMNKDKIESALKGEGKDAHWANSYFEGYLYNTDPVIGGFAMFYKKNMIEMEARAQGRLNDIMKDLKPALDDAGITFNDIGSLGQLIGFVDKVGTYDKETGKTVAKEIWTLLNPYKDYRLVIDTFNREIRDLEKAFNRSGSEVDRKNLRDKVAEKNKHLKKWFQQKYVDEYYEASDLLDKDALGKEADFQRKKITEEMTRLKAGAVDEFEMIEITKQLKQLWRDYKILHSMYYPNGNEKVNSYVDDAGVTHYSDDYIEDGPNKNNIINDKAIAQRLLEYKEASKKFHEFKVRPGVFENALKNFEQSIHQKIVTLWLGNKPDGSDPAALKEYNEQYEAMFTTYRNDWIKNNTRIQIKPKFYEEQGKILETIKRLTSKLPGNIANAKEFAENMIKTMDVISAYRDDDGQPIGSDIPDGRRKLVKDAQQAMIDARAEWAGLSGLTTDEMDTLQYYISQRKAGHTLPYHEYEEYKELIEKQKVSGLNEFEKAELNAAFAELNALRRKEPTEYYMIAVNSFLDRLGTDELYALIGGKEIDATNGEKLFEPAVLKILMADAKFKEWFEKNHLSKTYFDKDTKTKVPTFERLSIWNVVKPNDEDMYETTEIIREDGTSEFIPGIPSMAYSSRVVKKEFRTGYDPATGEVKTKVGVHRDNTNREDGWLPKNIPGSPYINDKYFELQRDNPKLFKVLEVITEAHLKNQEGLGKRSKLYLDFPRFEKSNLEMLQSKGLKQATKEKVSFFGGILSKLANFIRGRDKDNSEFSYKLQNDLVRADAFDDQIENIPIEGLYNLDLNETSTDIVSSMFRYLYGAEHHKQLVKMNPIASGIKNILEDPDRQIKEMNQINQSNFTNFGITTYLNKKGKYVRREAFSNMYNRDFMGETTTGAGKDWRGLQNIQRALFGRASFSFFAFNIPSALKNSLGAKFQALIHSAGGSDLTPAALVKGEGWSLNYMTQMSAKEIYNSGPKSLNYQIGEIFDPSQGRFRESFGESVTRTLGKDAAGLTWVTNFRKWTELQASMQTFAGMMYKHKIPMGVTEIDYMDAWELGPNNKIQLKAGIDPKYGITYDVDGNQIVGEEFKRFKMRVHSVMNKLNGAYAKNDQPEMNRYLAFRFIAFLRKYFTTMALNRFGTKRWNPGYNQVDEGYYVTAVKSFVKVLRTRDINAMLPEEQKAWMKSITEMGSLYLMGMLTGLLWGWDDDDEERFEKLRERSAFMATPGTREYQPDEHFDFGGFMSLHALNLMMQVRAENEQFMPGPGLSSMTDMLNLKSLAFGPTTDTYQQILGDVSDIWDDKGGQYYKRRVGAYKWQDQGGLKLWAHIAKSFGVSGSNIDPAQQITNFQKAQNLKK